MITLWFALNDNKPLKGRQRQDIHFVLFAKLVLDLGLLSHFFVLLLADIWDCTTNNVAFESLKLSLIYWWFTK